MSVIDKILLTEAIITLFFYIVCCGLTDSAPDWLKEVAVLGVYIGGLSMVITGIVKIWN